MGCRGGSSPAAIRRGGRPWEARGEARKAAGGLIWGKRNRRGRCHDEPSSAAMAMAGGASGAGSSSSGSSARRGRGELEFGIVKG
jgi:hypothetical protein